ncbi:MAG: MaoC family dehydratase [Acidimicrobiales bacterium]
MTVSPGTVLPERVIVVDAEKMKTMAVILRDSNPIHWDVETVRQLGMGDRVVNQGPINMAYVMDLLTDWAGGASTLRLLKVRFMANVFAGDTVRAGGTITGVRELDGETLVDLDVWLDVDGGRRALGGVATVASTER